MKHKTKKLPFILKSSQLETVKIIKKQELKTNNNNNNKNINNNNNTNNNNNNINNVKEIIDEDIDEIDNDDDIISDTDDNDFNNKDLIDSDYSEISEDIKNINKKSIEKNSGDHPIEDDNNNNNDLYAFLRIDNKHYYLNYEKNNEKIDQPKENLMVPTIVSATKKKRKISLGICVAHTRYRLITQVAKSLGWKILRESQHWNILWADSVPGVDVYKDMKRFQKINHFPGMVEICRKDLLARNLGRMLKLFPNDYNIFPKTWCFPADLGDAINYSKEHKHKTYILKPDQGAQGRGIWLTRNIKETVRPNERLICQVYISRPLLIDGFKFDLRVYTLVTTVEPLRIFVYNEGLVRFATSKYRDPSDYNTSDLFMHLTNYSVNKHSDQFRHDRKDGQGSKRNFRSLHHSLLKGGYDIDMLWRNIDDTIIKTILSCWPMLKHNYRACFPTHDVMQACFEILGFDILVDSTLKPYILEVNHSPSFHTDEPVDREVKEALVRDTLNLLNISLVDKKKIMNEDKRRVKMRLLKKVKVVQEKEINNNAKNICNQISPLGQQIAWEESHIGGFRRIMPAHVDQIRYAQFFHLQNQASIYNDTAASKRREEAAKELRNALIERDKKNMSYKTNNQNNSQKTNRQHSPIRRHKSSRTPHKDYLMKKEWSAGCLTNHDFDERERMSSLAQRDHIIRSSGIFEAIFQSFFRRKLLSDTDCSKYKDYYDKLENSDRMVYHSDPLSSNTSKEIVTINFNDITINKKNNNDNNENNHNAINNKKRNTTKNLLSLPALALKQIRKKI